MVGVGSGGSGVASGTVSGFGSVIVDGVEYDDSSAARDTEDASSNRGNAELKLGQRVRVVYSGAQLAQRIEVQAQLLGPVTAPVDGAGVVQVMGQKVRLVTSSADATSSNVTLLDGYGSATTIAVGDDVEVPGSWVYDTASASSMLVATRLEKRTDAPSQIQLGGGVSNYNASTGSFELEGVKIMVGSATITPTGASLANDAWVLVSGTVGSDAAINATSIRVRQASTTGDLATVRLSGAIETLIDQHSFVVRGVAVDAASATVDASCSGVTLAVGSVVECGGHRAERNRCGAGK